ncbi:conserved hypothetical protein [Candidatus Terasakiella magnetica]|uniref:Uncharacterized protein n=1 Tax=Candidatus Terasakiella magnetica TaxID=1867952 RepID=A0A1C3RGP1_9PROT|nr:hypothetical protein [Candidatus Terasakiella magnetica]SCA56374.1 conserved hypothetical protein [Candidatus Terasakiella magnetica]
MVDSVHTQIAYAPSEAGNDKKLSEEDAEKEFSFFGDDGFSFLDFVDVINPLQHIPVVSTAYRSLTGDEIDPGARLAGGTLFGGPIGLAASAFNVLLDHNTGMDAGEHVVAWFDGDEAPTKNPTMMAQNGQPAPNPAMSSFAPLPVPDSEADAFAAGEASLRMAKLQEFMNPALAKEVPMESHAMPEAQGAGSAGTWEPPLNQAHPFPTERTRAGSAMPKDMTSLFQARQPVAEVAQAQAQPQIQPKPQVQTQTQAVSNSQQPVQRFQSKQSYEESSLAALQAFARDVKAQKQQTQAQEVEKQVVAPKPVASNTAQLSQTQNNAWFAEMMSQNMDQYRSGEIKG